MDRARLIIAWALVGVFVLSLVFPTVDGDADARHTLNTVVLVAAGFLFRPSLRRKKNKDEEEEEA